MELSLPQVGHQHATGKKDLVSEPGEEETRPHLYFLQSS
jgi:hypothetical protein